MFKYIRAIPSLTVGVRWRLGCHTFPEEYDEFMKSIMLAGVLLASGAWGADEAAERAAIGKTIAALSGWPARGDLFTADFDGPAKGVVPVVCPEVWWETCGQSLGGVLVIQVVKIRFLTPEVATVDAVGTARVFLVMKKEGTDWKIASPRVLR
jgi:hypothetical protein